VVDKIPGVVDSICVGQRRQHDKDEAVVLFVKTASGTRLTPRLRDVIRESIRQARSPRHVPKYIFEVGDIPYTSNGKKIELAVKSIISNRDASPSTSSVANPNSFDLYRKFYSIEQAQLEVEGRQAKL
jgi:acetoacetyl-CoA synthetase